jgi:hypothetical protein
MIVGQAELLDELREADGAPDDAATAATPR